jgi:lysyl-tRNA synthetase class 2
MPRERTEQEERRREERRQLEERGVEPYAYSFDPDAHAADLLADFDDEEHGEDGGGELRARVAGRITALRVMGGSSFFDVQDESGTIQVYIRRDEMPEGFYDEVFTELLDLGDIVGVGGPLFRTHMGEVTVRAEEMKLLSKSLRPMPTPKEKETEDGEVEVYNEVTDKDFRYRQRYVDLAVNPDVREVFRQRAQILRLMRHFLDERGYLEVETPVLQPIYGGAAARPFTTHHHALDMPLYLRIADELYLKRLLVGGLEGVYEISKDFRNEGLSRFHNPEFTMMELYVAYRDYDWMMDLTETLVTDIATELHDAPEVTFEGETISLERPWRRVPFFDAIAEHADGLDLYGASQAEVFDAAEERGLDVDESMDKGKLLDEVFSELVETHLVEPTFVTDYPVELSPLAKRHREKEGLVERFELIVAGRELCNAFSELNDPDDQRARFEEQSRYRADDGAPAPIDEDYLRALEYGMPPAAGLGIGIDRLTMLMTGQESIRDVVLFPLMRPEAERGSTPGVRPETGAVKEPSEENDEADA